MHHSQEQEKKSSLWAQKRRSLPVITFKPQMPSIFLEAKSSLPVTLPFGIYSNRPIRLSASRDGDLNTLFFTLVCHLQRASVNSSKQKSRFSPQLKNRFADAITNLSPLISSGFLDCTCFVLGSRSQRFYSCCNAFCWNFNLLTLHAAIFLLVPSVREFTSHKTASELQIQISGGFLNIFKYSKK